MRLLPMTCLAAALLVSTFARAASDGTCHAWIAAAAVAPIDASSVDQVSGLAAGTSDLLWAQEDAGEDADLIALGTDGASLGRVAVSGATNTDWEDLALGPCPPGPQEGCACLYIADFGSNDLDRDGGVIWRVPEPDPSAASTLPAEALRFRYPDGPHDAEALLLHPTRGTMAILTKEAEGPAKLYGFPLGTGTSTTDTVTLDALGAFDADDHGASSDRVTGAAVSPLGERLLVRTTSDLLLFDLGSRDFAAALGGPAALLPVADGADGEAATFSPDGRAVWVVDEGDQPTLWRVACADWEETQVAEPFPLGTCPAGGCGCGVGGGLASPWAALGLLALSLRRRQA